jgi:O-succinylbenzoate synthase
MSEPAPTRSPLRVDGATLRLVRLPLVTPFTIATGTMTEKLFPLLTLRADGLEGHAEGVMDRCPTTSRKPWPGRWTCWRGC